MVMPAKIDGSSVREHSELTSGRTFKTFNTVRKIFKMSLRWAYRRN